MNLRIAREITYTECKTFGHAWDRAPASTPSSVVFGLVLRCTRCFTIRHDHLDDLGNVLSRSYDYAEGYAQIGVKLTKSELRLAYLTLNKAKAKRRLRAVS
jgi:hypothetical protein